MEEKIESLYQEYLYKELDLVFSCDEKKKSTFKVNTNGKKEINNDFSKYKIIKKANKYNYQDSNGKLISSVWFDNVDYNGFCYGYAKVFNKGKCNYIDTNGELISNEWFDYAEERGFMNGYAWVKKDGKYNYINKEGKLISDEWYDLVESEAFAYGYAWVYNDGKYNYINTEGKIISKEWYDSADKFINSFARVSKGYTANFINTSGKLVSNEWFDTVNSKCFEYGYAWVFNEGKYNYINPEGKLISDLWFDDMEDYGFMYGYAMIENDGKYNYINTEGKLMCEEWFDGAKDKCFENGFAWVKKDGKYNYVNTEGKIISNEWFDDIDINCFVNDIVLVKKDGKYNYLNKNGQLISKLWFDSIGDFIEGYAWVKKDDKYNFIDKNGNLIRDEWFDYVQDFSNGYAVIIERDFYRKRNHAYINKEGKIVTPYYDLLLDFKNGLGLARTDVKFVHINNNYGSVETNAKFNFFNTNCHLISDVWLDNFEYRDNLILVEVNNRKSFIVPMNGKVFIGYKNNLYYKKIVFIENDSFINVDGKIIPIDISLGNYSVKKHMMGYELFNGIIKFNTKYKPIKIYGERYVLCLNKNQVYLYDRFKNSYKLLGQASKIIYDNNFIFDKEKDKVYFINENELLDITKYYKEKLEGNSFSITKGIKIENIDTFSYTNSEEVDKAIKEENDRKKKDEEEERKLEEEKRINDQLVKLQQAEEEIENQAQFLINNIELSIKKLEEIIQNGKIKISKLKRIETDNLFIKENDYYVFDPFVLEHLHFYELSKADFHNVKVEGIDFHKTNVEIGNLLDCYNRSIRNCNFEGISISPFADFTGVDIRGCHFGKDNNPSRIDTIPNFEDAIYDETTTYNGVPISKILNVKKKVMM